MGSASSAVVARPGREAGAALRTPVRHGRDAPITRPGSRRGSQEAAAAGGGVQSGVAAADQAWRGNAARAGGGEKGASGSDFGAIGSPQSARIGIAGCRPSMAPHAPRPIQPHSNSLRIPSFPEKRAFGHGLLRVYPDSSVFWACSPSQLCDCCQQPGNRDRSLLCRR